MVPSSTKTLVDDGTIKQVIVCHIKRIELKVVAIRQHVASRKRFGFPDAVRTGEANDIAIAAIDNAFDPHETIAIQRGRRERDAHTRFNEKRKAT